MPLEEITLDSPRLKRRQRRTISLRWLLALVFGSLVGLSVFSVLAVSVFTNFSNTFSLLNDSTERLVTGMQNSIRDQTLQAERVVESVAQLYADNGFELSNLESQELYLKSLVIAAPIVEGILIYDADGRKSGLQRKRDGSFIRFSGDKIEAKEVMEDLKIGGERLSAEPVWGNPVVHHGVPFHNVSHSLIRNGSQQGTAVALIGAGAVNKVIRQIGADVDTPVFVLDHRSNIIAHSKRAVLFAKRSSYPLAEFPDPVLVQLLDATLSSRFEQAADSGIKILSTPGRRGNIFILTELPGYSEVPYTLGAYFSKTDIGEEIMRAAVSALVGLATLVLSVLIAIFLGNRLARPMTGIAKAAQYFSNFELEKFEKLPPSRIQEIDNQTAALNAMHTTLSEFTQYVPRSVVQRLMQSGTDSTRSVEREVTILFSDIVGFTTLSEHLNAAQTAALLNEHFEMVCKAIHDCNGVVDKFMGDNVMAFWGAPNADKDHAKNAVCAARRIAVALARDNRQRVQNGLPPLRLRIGIHTGRAVVGNIGGDKRQNYTIIGDTVNVGQRLEQLGKEVMGDKDLVVLVSDALVEASGEAESFEPVGSWTLRGRQRPVSVYVMILDGAESGGEIIDFPAREVGSGVA